MSALAGWVISGLYYPIISNYVGIAMNHYDDPYEPISIVESRFFCFHDHVSKCAPKTHLFLFKKMFLCTREHVIYRLHIFIILHTDAFMVTLGNSAVQLDGPAQIPLLYSVCIILIVLLGYL